MVLSQRKIPTCHGNGDDSSCTQLRNESWGLESLLAGCAWTSAHQWVDACLYTPCHLKISGSVICKKTKHLHTENIFKALELLTTLHIEAKKTKEVENFRSSWLHQTQVTERKGEKKGRLLNNLINYSFNNLTYQMAN